MGTEQLGGAQMASLTELSRGSLPMDLTCREYEVVPELCSRTYSNMEMTPSVFRTCIKKILVPSEQKSFNR